MEAEHAILDDELKTIAKNHRGKDGGRPAFETYLDAKAIKPGITLELVKSWLKKNVEPTRYVVLIIATTHREPITSTKLICSLLPTDSSKIRTIKPGCP